MNSFVNTNGKGQFVLDGKPWYYHGATYYGPGPHYWGDGSWIGKDFEQALALAPDDMARMKDLGLNALGLFIPGASFSRNSNRTRRCSPAWTALLTPSPMPECVRWSSR